MNYLRQFCWTAKTSGSTGTRQVSCHDLLATLLVQLLKAWQEEDEKEDEQEQRDTWEQLKQALDQDRLSNRKLFP